MWNWSTLISPPILHQLNMTSHVYITINLFSLCQHFFLPFYTYFSKYWHRLNETIFRCPWSITLRTFSVTLGPPQGNKERRLKKYIFHWLGNNVACRLVWPFPHPKSQKCKWIRLWFDMLNSRMNYRPVYITLNYNFVKLEPSG